MHTHTAYHTLVTHADTNTTCYGVRKRPSKSHHNLTLCPTHLLLSIYLSIYISIFLSLHSLCLSVPQKKTTRIPKPTTQRPRCASPTNMAPCWWTNFTRWTRPFSWCASCGTSQWRITSSSGCTTTGRSTLTWRAVVSGKDWCPAPSRRPVTANDGRCWRRFLYAQSRRTQAHVWRITGSGMGRCNDDVVWAYTTTQYNHSWMYFDSIYVVSCGCMILKFVLVRSLLMSEYWRKVIHHEICDSLH